MAPTLRGGHDQRVRHSLPARLAHPCRTGPITAVIWYGPSDLTSSRGRYDPQSSTTPEALLVGESPAAAAEGAQAASPLAHAHPGAPPFLLIHSEEDTLVPSSRSQDLATRLNEMGAPVQLRTVRGADHGWYGLTGAQVEDIFEHSLQFVRLSTQRSD
ncbi:prolyl oligopeptidase family serine peptidase [Streptomyces tubercidicus]|uniref:prolyl oligopeptidase family serine peptidase n=1 Tax=Streptomyces tubercidicus TaxID=47759 RepID=UPI002E1794A3